jgi:hypothetical protein
MKNYVDLVVNEEYLTKRQACEPGLKAFREFCKKNNYPNEFTVRVDLKGILWAYEKYEVLDHSERDSFRHIWWLLEGFPLTQGMINDLANYDTSNLYSFETSSKENVLPDGFEYCCPHDSVYCTQILRS